MGSAARPAPLCRVPRDAVSAARVRADVAAVWVGGVTQIKKGDGEVVITNDGATILKTMAVQHPAAKMVRAVSRAEPRALPRALSRAVPRFLSPCRAVPCRVQLT